MQKNPHVNVRIRAHLPTHENDTLTVKTYVVSQLILSIHSSSINHVVSDSNVLSSIVLQRYLHKCLFIGTLKNASLYKMIELMKWYLRINGKRCIEIKNQSHCVVKIGERISRLFFFPIQQCLLVCWSTP